MRKLILITGASGSGKTTFSMALSKRLAKGNIKTQVIFSDDYYKDHSHLSEKDRASYDFCQPSAIDFELLEKHVLCLLKGENVERPVYDMKTSSRKEGVTVTVEPADVLIVEGLLVGSSDYLQSLAMLKIFLNEKLDICLARRLPRDKNEREIPYEVILAQYNLIRSSFFRHTKPLKYQIDFYVIPSRYAIIAVEEIAKTIEAPDNDINFLATPSVKA